MLPAFWPRYGGTRSGWALDVVGAHAELREGWFEAAAHVHGEAGALLLWLWGRGGQRTLTVQGDGMHVAALRRALAPATQ